MKCDSVFRQTEKWLKALDRFDYKFAYHTFTLTWPWTNWPQIQGAVLHWKSGHYVYSGLTFVAVKLPLFPIAIGMTAECTTVKVDDVIILSSRTVVYDVKKLQINK